MEAAIDEMIVEFAQRVHRQIVADPDHALLEFRLHFDFLEMLEIVSRLGHLPGGKLGKLDFPFFLQVSGVHHPSRRMDYCALVCMICKPLRRFRACWNW